MTTDLERFVRIVQQRSWEHRHSLRMMHMHRFHGASFALLRQQLDTLIRLVYLLNEPDLDYRDQLIAATVRGERWRKKTGRGYVTDRDMVKVTSRLHGWAQSLYGFGCGFVHLSNYYDYLAEDPLRALPRDERRYVLDFVNRRHRFNFDESTTFEEFAECIPRVFEKLDLNVDEYLDDLLAERALGDQQTYRSSDGGQATT